MTKYLWVAAAAITALVGLNEVITPARAYDPQNGTTWSISVCINNGVERGGPSVRAKSREVCEQKAKRMKQQGRKILK